MDRKRVSDFFHRTRKCIKFRTPSQASFGGPTIVIGSDTVVVHGEKILEKPKSPDDALEMLTTLQGKTHTVISSIVLLKLDAISAEPEVIGEFAETRVTFDEVSQRALEAYINTQDPM